MGTWKAFLRFGIGLPKPAGVQHRIVEIASSKSKESAERLAVTCSRSPAKDSRRHNHWTLGEARTRSREADRQTSNEMLDPGYPFWLFIRREPEPSTTRIRAYTLGPSSPKP